MSQGADHHVGGPGNDRLDAVWADDGNPDLVQGDNGRDRIATNDAVPNDFGTGGLGIDSCLLDPGDAVAC